MFSSVTRDVCVICCLYPKIDTALETDVSESTVIARVPIDLETMTGGGGVTFFIFLSFKTLFQSTFKSRSSSN
jgi:hypothetical protein